MAQFKVRPVYKPAFALMKVLREMLEVLLPAERERIVNLLGKGYCYFCFSKEVPGHRKSCAGLKALYAPAGPKRVGVDYFVRPVPH